MPAPVIRPIFLEADGVFARLLNGAIINIGGTVNSTGTFTVNDKGLLFDDGTSTAPGGGSGGLTLQRVYDLTPGVAGEAAIKLATGKDFILKDDTDNSVFFKVDAETGKVTITGDLEVLGNSTIIDTVIQDSDHWRISPRSGATSALRIEPDIGVIPFVDLVTIRRVFGGTPVFRIDSTGNMVSTQNLIISGLVDGVDISQLKIDFDAHVDGTALRHEAEDITIDPIASIPTATNVQEALADINVRIDNINTGITNVRGYEHVQLAPQVTWVITHNLSTFRIQVTIYDGAWEQIIPENIKVIDGNTALVSLTTSMDGRAIIVGF